MLDHYLIEHCSPTLASIKTANLFSCPFAREEDLEEQISVWNRLLDGKGITLMILRKTDKAALIYVCRLEKLAKDLKKPGVAEFLQVCGYEKTDPGSALEKLQERVSTQENFPHEIGLFLGYPAEDVSGFIRHGARCAKCVGTWKVYGDEESARKKFALYQKCTRLYCEAYRKHNNLDRLLVRTHGS